MGGWWGGPPSTPTISPLSSGIGCDLPIYPASTWRVDLEPGEPVHRLDRRRAHTAGRRGGEDWGAFDARGGASAGHPPHLGPGASDQDGRDHIGGDGSFTSPGATILASQRASLRRTAG